MSCLNSPPARHCTGSIDADFPAAVRAQSTADRLVEDVEAFEGWRSTCGASVRVKVYQDSTGWGLRRAPGVLACSALTLRGLIAQENLNFAK